MALLIISLAVYTFNQYRKIAEDSSIVSKSSQIDAFNRFFIYSKPSSGRILGFEVYNLLSKVKDINTNDNVQDRVYIQYKTEAPFFAENQIDSLLTRLHLVPPFPDQGLIPEGEIQYYTRQYDYEYDFSAQYGQNGKINLIRIK